MALEFLLKLQDMMTPKLGIALQKADSQLNRLQSNAIRGNRQMGASFEDMRKRVEQLRESAQKSTDWRLFKDATRQANDLEKQMDRLQSKASGTSSGGFWIIRTILYHLFQSKVYQCFRAKFTTMELV